MHKPAWHPRTSVGVSMLGTSLENGLLSIPLLLPIPGGYHVVWAKTWPIMCKRVVMVVVAVAMAVAAGGVGGGGGSLAVAVAEVAVGVWRV